MASTRRKVPASPVNSPSRGSGGRDASSSKRPRRNSGAGTSERQETQGQQPQARDQGRNACQETYLYEPVLRQFYPPEMDNARCKSYIDGPLSRPIEILENAINEHSETLSNTRVKHAVVHWFKTDLRLGDNRALHRAYQLAKQHDVPLICLYILSPEDLTAHLSSSARVNHILRTLGMLQKDLNALDIPLYMETQERRTRIPDRIVDLCQEWGANHIFANIEYEVDELRREAKLIRSCAARDIAFQTIHDTCVITPGQLESKQGKQYSVFSPWYKSWVTHLYQNPTELQVLDKPGRSSGNPREAFSDLFQCAVPDAPENKRLSDQQKNHLRQLYPPGEDAALSRLDTFLREKASEYADFRDYITGETTSVLSPYFSCGSLSARTAVRRARDANRGELDDGGSGFSAWIREVAFRDFYKHVLVHWPYIWYDSPRSESSRIHHPNQAR